VYFRDFQGDRVRIDAGVEVLVQKSGQLYHFSVELKGTFDTFCHRCLAPVPFAVETRFDVVVQRGGVIDDRGEDDEADEFIHLPMGENEVTLDAQIYENLIVSIPMQILCREDCKGLCAGCGANLNVEECSCRPAIDPRWDALRRLKDE